MRAPETSAFAPGGLPGRSFADPADYNSQLADWLVHADSRTVRVIGGRPVDLFELILEREAGALPDR